MSNKILDSMLEAHDRVGFNHAMMLNIEAHEVSDGDLKLAVEQAVDILEGETGEKIHGVAVEVSPCVYVVSFVMEETALCV